MLKRKYVILEKWKDDATILLKKLYPDVKKEKLGGILDNIIDSNLATEDMQLNNTYQEKVLYSDSLDVSEYFFKAKPSSAGNGVLFDKDQFNPALNMLEAFGIRRKQYKKLMKQFEKNSFGFNMNNLYQNNEKVKMNAW